jgi:predicted dehydrogenase
VGEADRVMLAAAAAGRQVAVHHQFREMPIFRALLDEVARDGADALTFVQVWQMMDLAPWSETGWRGGMAERTLYEAGVHLLDLVLALFQEVPVSVQASTSAAGQPGETADAIVVATLEFSRGRLAQITQNRMCKGPMQYFEVRADMPSASLRASFGGRSRLSAGLHRGTKPHVRFEFGLSGMAWKETGAHRRVIARNPKAPMVAASRQVITRTLDAFRSGAEPPTSAQRARDIMAVVAACYRSAATGQRISLE